MVGTLDDDTFGVHVHEKEKNETFSHAAGGDATMAETTTALSTGLSYLLAITHCFPLGDTTYDKPVTRPEPRTTPNTGRARINKNAGGPRRLTRNSEATAQTKGASASSVTSRPINTSESKPTTSSEDKKRKPVINKYKDGPRPITISHSSALGKEGPRTSKSAETDTNQTIDENTRSAVIPERDNSRATSERVEKHMTGGDKLISEKRDENIREGIKTIPTNEKCTNERGINDNGDNSNQTHGVADAAKVDSDDSVEKTVQSQQLSQEPLVVNVRPAGELHSRIEYDNPPYRR